MAMLIVEDEWPATRAAERFNVSTTTARRWAQRYRAEGKAGMADRSSRPHVSPAKTAPVTTKRIVALRLRKRWGAVRLAAECGVAASTAGAVLRRCGVSRLSRLDRRAQTVNRYEHAAPGELLHADVKKLGNIPAGGGWRFRGRQAGKANRHLDGGRARNRHHNPLMGHGFIHVVLDDHSRVAYAPAGLRRDLLGRDRPDRRRRAAARRGLVRRPRGDRPPRAHRQRRLLPQPRLGRGLRPARPHTQADPPLPTADQRQGRAVQPHHDQ
jgi:hypothetical protein